MHVLTGLLVENRVSREVKARSEAEDGLKQSQGMEAVGILTGGIALDFHNLPGMVQACRTFGPLIMKQGSGIPWSWPGSELLAVGKRTRRLRVGRILCAVRPRKGTSLLREARSQPGRFAIGWIGSILATDRLISLDWAGFVQPLATKQEGFHSSPPEPSSKARIAASALALAYCRGPFHAGTHSLGIVESFDGALRGYPRTQTSASASSCEGLSFWATRFTQRA